MGVIWQLAQARKRVRELERQNTRLKEEVEEKYRDTVDIPSPRDIIAQANISYDEVAEEITIRDIKSPIWLTTVQDTNSMDATVDAGHTCILTKNFECKDLAIGDIIVYEQGGRHILHRIMKIEVDEVGRKYTLKGDNNYYPDPYEVRDEQVEWLLLGVIY